jgi:hypothetical protein
MSEDLENLLKLFDYALSSDNPAVKKALKNLLLVVSIVEPQEEAGKPGPLTEIKMELQLLRSEIAKLKNDMNMISPTRPSTNPYTYPAYPYNPNTTGPYNPNSSGGLPWIGARPGGTWTTTSTSSSGSISGPSISDSSSFDIDSEMMKYISSMIKNDDTRFDNKDIT